MELVTDKMDWFDLIYNNQSIKDKIQYQILCVAVSDSFHAKWKRKHVPVAHFSFGLLREFFFIYKSCFETIPT